MELRIAGCQNLTKLWQDEATQCAEQMESLSEHIPITWHNVNGLAGFIEALSLNPDGYFLSGLIPDVFGILEAKVSEDSPNTPRLVQSLEALMLQVTGEQYHVVQSLRGSQQRCGTVLMLRVGFLKSRQWWTWIGDLHSIQPGETWEEAGYAFNPAHHSLSKHQEWKRNDRYASDGDGRVIQLILGPKVHSNGSHGRPCTSIFAVFKLIICYVRNSSSGEGDPTARINFDLQGGNITGLASDCDCG